MMEGVTSYVIIDQAGVLDIMQGNDNGVAGSVNI